MGRGHFEREAYLQWLYFVPFAIGLVVVMASVMCFGALEHARIDDCLDRGASWNYEERACQTEQEASE